MKRSRFRCRLARVEDEAAARAVIEEQRRLHWQARHHCSAFILGPDSLTERSNDDGEPAGTAGAPMLDALRGAGLSDTVAVVTRWFGGVLLGTGGLARAYGDAVRAAVAVAPVVARRQVEQVCLSLGYADAARVETEVRQHGIPVLAVEYGDLVRLSLGVPAQELPQITDLVSALTGGSVEYDVLGQRWLDRPE